MNCFPAVRAWWTVGSLALVVAVGCYSGKPPELPEPTQQDLETAAGTRVANELVEQRVIDLGGDFEKEPIAISSPGGPSITLIDLNKSDVTDADLSELAKALAALPTLHTVLLNDTAIGDAGLAALNDAKSLKKVEVASTQVTDAAINALKQAVPGCEVFK